MLFSKGGWLTMIYYLLFILVFKLSPFTTGALIIGVYLSTIVEVPQKLLGKKMNAKSAKIISNIIIFGLMIYAFANFFPVIINEAQNIFKTVQNIQLSETENLNIPDWLIEIVNNLNTSISQIVLKVLNSAISYLPSTISAIIVIAVTTIVINTLKPSISKNLWKLYPTKERTKGTMFMKKSYHDFEKFVRGQFLVATFVGIFVGIGCFITGIPGALFLGILSWITDFIPFIGIIIATIPVIMLGFSAKGLFGIIAGLIIIVAANQLETWVLSPRVQSDNLNLHWFVILVSILMFGEFFGVLGILLALPSVMYFINFWNTFFLNNDENIK